MEKERLAGSIAYAAAGGSSSIERRLRELDQEWEIERIVMAGGALAGLVGLLLAVRSNRAWLLIPLASVGLLLEHAVVGDGVAARALRRRGFMSVDEIELERLALKALRGDLRRVPPIVEGRDRPAVERLLDMLRP